MENEHWQRAERLFHEALARPPETRREFLDKACGCDADLRRLVGLLVSADERAGNLLETPILPDAPSTQYIRGSLVGKQLGWYEIVALLGVGGMGEVYRGHDRKLGRDVAIKTLPPAFAHDPERLARLEREARTLASLNHPNIAAIYGLEEHGGLDFLVLELVNGGALRGPLAIARALDYATQLAEALEAAHKSGVIHRDLKPANVKVTSEGRVKVLDFGLAKALWETDAQKGVAPTITLEDCHTMAGGIIGTPAYMSPEQACGKTIDHRSDIWAFGCILFELLSGISPFARQTTSDTIAAVLEREPDWRALPPKTPVRVRELLRYCLKKKVEARLPNICEATKTLEASQRGWSRWRVAALAAACTAALAAGAGFWLRGLDRPPVRSEWVQLTQFSDPVSQPALSPNGGVLTFVRSASTFFASGQIYIKPLPDGEPVQLTHDSLAKTNPAFTPDGANVTYTTVDSQFEWDTWIISVKGGQPQIWQRNVSDLTWAGPRLVLFSERPRKGIIASEQERGHRDAVYLPSNTRGVAHRPHASPDGKWVLVTELDGYGDWQPCRLVPINGSTNGRQVGPPGAGCTFAEWSPDGKWMYLTSKAGGRYHIWRQRFPEGQPEQFTSGLTEEEGAAVAPDGRSLVTAVALQSSSIWLHDQGQEKQISTTEGNAAYARFTPDGRKVCYRLVKEVPRFGTARDPGQLWVADLDSGRTERLVAELEPLDYDISPDGRQVVFDTADRDGKPRVWLAPMDRNSPPRMIRDVEGRQAMFGPDGEIFFRRIEGSTGFVYRIHQDGSGLKKADERPILALTGISPDGLWLEVWAPLGDGGPPAVQMYPIGGGGPVIIGGNTLLQWPRSGQCVWIQGGPVPDGKTYVVPLPHGETLPSIPAGGLRSESEVAHLPGARRIEVMGAPGISDEKYAFERRTIQRNLYRIPIP